MNRNYIVLVIIAVGLAIGMLLMDRIKQVKEIEPIKLAIAYNDPSRFLSVDEVADRLIKKDPGLVLIDVRTAEQFNAFSIPGSINIPIDSLLSSTAVELLQKPELDKILYSNADVSSDQAWLLCTRLSLPNVFVLQGGVNNWFKSIVQVTEPVNTDASEVFDTYSFRMGVKQYFYGSKDATIKADDNKINQPVQKKVATQRSVPSAATGGGC